MKIPPLAIASLAIATLLSTLAPAIAQDTSKPEGETFVNQYSRKYKPVSESDIANITRGNLLEGGRYDIQFARHPDDAYGIVNLRIESPLNIQGCGSAEVPRIAVKRSGRKIEIAFDSPRLVPGAEMRYPHYQCKITNATPRIDIALSRNELIAHKIKTIALKTSRGADQYTVEVSKNALSLLAQTPRFFFPGPRQSALTHVFYPVNMVVLRAPLAAKDKNLVYKMDLLAKKHKLTPIDTPIPNAKPYQFYALDKEYNVMLPLQRRGITKLDTIVANDILYGPDGEYTIPREVDVFVTLPGEFD